MNPDPVEDTDCTGKWLIYGAYGPLDYTCDSGLACCVCNFVEG